MATIAVAVAAAAAIVEPATSQFRLEHAVSMQNRGLLRYPLAVEPPPPPTPTPPPPPPAPPSVSAANPAARGRDEGDETPAPPPSLRPSPLAAGCPEASGAAGDGGTRAGDDGGGASDDTAVGVRNSGNAGASDVGDDGADLEDTLDPAVGDDPPESAQSEAAAPAAAGMAVAAAAAAPAEARPVASPSSPRLELWPGFPCPSKVFARAAPMENPKGVLPPSPDVLRFIHQVIM